MAEAASVNLTKPKAKPAAKKPAVAAKPKSTPFKSLDDIKLGMKVRDPVSGLIGIATFKSEQISGTVQYAVTPQGDGDKVHDGNFIDDFMLEHVDDGVSARTPAADPNAKFVLGAELEDTITGFKGIATDRTTYINGCVHYTLTPQARKNSLLGKMLGEPGRSTHFDYKRLIKIGEGIAGPPPRPTKEEPKPAEQPVFKRSSTGGPMRAAPSSRAPSSRV